MERRIQFSIIIWHMMMMMMSSVGARNMQFAPSNALLNQDQIMQSRRASFVVQQGIGSKVGNEEEVLSRLGSRPPRCEHKCRGCAPCSPIQVPTARAHVGPQYANYEPEGWKCKCGSVFFNP